MKERGIPANGDDGLVHAEGAELSETAGDAASRAHAVEGLDGAEAGGQGSHDVAADVPADEPAPAVQLQGVVDGPVGRPMGAPGTERHASRGSKALGQVLHFPGEVFRNRFIGDSENPRQGGKDEIGVEFPHRGDVSRFLAEKGFVPDFMAPFGGQGLDMILQRGGDLLNEKNLPGRGEVFFQEPLGQGPRGGQFEDAGAVLEAENSPGFGTV